MAFIDTIEYYDRRKRQIQLILLRRLYYRGCPYTGDPLDERTQGLWVELLSPSDASTPPSYLENPIRQLIDGTVSDLYPPDSQLFFGDLDKAATEALGKKLLRFGPRFLPGLAGFNHWLMFVLADIAQGGDGLLFPRLLPDRAGLRLHYYPAEHWEVELGADADEPDFYRVQFYFTEAIGDRVQETWRRFDVYKDRIQRYIDERMPDDANPSEADKAKLQAIDPDLIMFMPPPMTEQQPADLEQLERALAEQIQLEQLGDFPCVVLRWNLTEEGDARGEPLATLDKLFDADDNSRLLTSHVSSAIKTGNQLLGLFDVDLPPAEGDDEDKLETTEVAGNPVVKFSSEGDRSGHWGYPDNLPTTSMHAETRKELRQAMFSPSQNLGVPMSELMKSGGLTGFDWGQLNKYHNAMIDKLRSRLIENGVLQQIRIGMKLAQLAGVITAEEAASDPRIQYGSQPYSPDEQLKIATAIGMYKNYGVPPSELANLMPFKPLDAKNLVAEMEKYIKQQQEMSAAASLARIAAPPQNGTPKGISPKANPQRSGKDAAGVDKRGR